MSSFAHLLALLKGVVEMMEVRGYNVAHFANLARYTPELFESTMPAYFKAAPTPLQEQLRAEGRASFRCMMSHIFTHNLNPADRYLVYFAEMGTTKFIPVTEAQVFGLLLEKQKCTAGMIVTHNKMSPPAAARIDELEAPGIYFLQRWLDEEALVNPLESEWNSETTILPPDETKTFLSKIHYTRLPKITVDEPVAKYLGVRAGQILQLRRDAVLPDTLCDEEIFYRYAARRPPEKKKSAKAPGKTIPQTHI